MPPQPMGRQGLPVASGGQRKQRRTPPLPPESLRRCTALPTPRFWTYGLQNCEGTRLLFYASELEAICSGSPTNESSYFEPCTPNSDAKYW